MRLHTFNLLAGLFLTFLIGTKLCADVSFSREIAPIIVRNCANCHGEKTNLGGYRAHTFDAMLKPGTSGKRPVVTGKPNDSHLVNLISSASASARMPKGDDPLTPAQVSLVRRWIAEGAKFDGPSTTATLKSYLAPRKRVVSPKLYRAPVATFALAFTPGGRWLVVGGYYELLVFDSRSGRLNRHIPFMPQRIQSLQFNARGDKLLVGGGAPGEYGEVVIVDFSGTSTPIILDTFGDIVLSAQFSSDESLAVSGGAEAVVRVYDLSTHKRKWESRVHSDWVNSVGFSSDGKYVSSASKDMTVKVYETQTGSLFTTYSGHNRQIGNYKGQDPVMALKSQSDSPVFFSAGAGKWIQIWEPEKAKAETGDAGDMEDRFAKQGHARYLPHGFAKDVLALCVKGGRLYATGGDGVVKQFDSSNLKVTQTFQGPSDWLFSLDYDPASGCLAAGSFGGEITVWDANSGRQLSKFTAKP